MKAIITGGAGFLGSALAEELKKNGYEVYAIDKSKKRNEIIELDMRDIDKLPDIIPDRDFDVWYQFAWEGLAGEAMINYHTQIANIEWILNAINVAAKMGCKKFVGAGSISQYEMSLPQVINPKDDKHCFFKVANMACQHMGRVLAENVGIEFIWPIITNVYGVGENSPRLINSMIRNLQAGKHQSLSEGKQFYDFIYITDAAKAFRLIGEKGIADREYVIAQGDVKPLKEFLTIVRDVVAPETELGFGELNFNGYYLPKECYSIKSLVQDTGFTPEVSFKEGIRMTAEWIHNSSIGGVDQ